MIVESYLLWRARLSSRQRVVGVRPRTIRAVNKDLVHIGTSLDTPVFQGLFNAQSDVSGVMLDRWNKVAWLTART
jgi:hypothetical protein